ncbi:MAG: hypothetical protein H7A46_17000 [Verrucomicrobiales bacterium]|nr:hypothetical protein [Verrucomicrobiales bacterium]
MKPSITLLRLFLITSLLGSLLTPEALASSPVLGVMFAQGNIVGPINDFMDLLQALLMLFGLIAIAYGGWLITQGRKLEGFMAILGGFILCMAVPIVRYFVELAGGSGITP